MPDGFAQEGLGQILFHLSRFNREASQWLYEMGKDRDKSVKGISNWLSVSHDHTFYPVEGIPFLQIRSSISVDFGIPKCLWWEIMLNLGMDAGQTVISRFRIERLHSNNEVGPHDVKIIQRSALPSGQEGIELIESICNQTLESIKQNFFDKTASELFEVCQNKVYLPQATHTIKE